MITKILNLDDSADDNSFVGALDLIVKVAVDYFEIMLTEMLNYKCIFSYKFQHQNKKEDDIYVTPATEVNPISKLEHVGIHVLDAIRMLNSPHLQDQIISNYTRL